MTNWTVRAACKGMDPDLFFPHRANCIEAYRASLICQACPVRRECLNDAINADRTSGVFGGEFFNEGKHKPISNPKDTMDRSALAQHRRAEALDEFENLADQGITQPNAVKMIAARYGVTTGSVHDWLRLARADRDGETATPASWRTPGPPTARQLQAVARYHGTRHLYRSNAECRRAVAEGLGVHPGTVEAWVRASAKTQEPETVDA
jgi:WhiB family redox-sensing transcriptional regulator